MVEQSRNERESGMFMTAASCLSHIETQWSLIRRAHTGSEETVRAAQQILLERYGPAIRRYLSASLKNNDAAEEVFQEFALRFINRQFNNVSPQQGRFRSFVKTALHNLMVDWHRERHRKSRGIANAKDRFNSSPPPFDEETFHRVWRQELLDRSWAILEEFERKHGTPFYSVLRIIVDFPSLSSSQLAERITSKFNRTYTAGNVRVMIHRARILFAEALINEVRDSLNASTPDEIESELIDLELHAYCRNALKRYRKTFAELQIGDSARLACESPA